MATPRKQWHFVDVLDQKEVANQIEDNIKKFGSVLILTRWTNNLAPNLMEPKQYEEMYKNFENVAASIKPTKHLEYMDFFTITNPKEKEKLNKIINDAIVFACNELLEKNVGLKEAVKKSLLSSDIVFNLENTKTLVKSYASTILQSFLDSFFKKMESENKGVLPMKYTALNSYMKGSSFSESVERVFSRFIPQTPNQYMIKINEELNVANVVLSREEKEIYQTLAESVEMTEFKMQNMESILTIAIAQCAAVNLLNQPFAQIINKYLMLAQSFNPIEPDLLAPSSPLSSSAASLSSSPRLFRPSSSSDTEAPDSPSSEPISPAKKSPPST